MTPIDASTLTAAVLTPSGRGAVATIRVTGSPESLCNAIDQHFHSSNGLPLREQTIGAIRFGHWCEVPNVASNARNEAARNLQSADSGAVEEVVVCRTNPVTLEINCHGGEIAVTRILSHLNQRGATTISWRHQPIEDRSRFDAECLEALSHASTLRTARLLLEQAQGLLRTQLHHLLSRIEQHGLAAAKELTDALQSLMEWSAFGIHLTEPWRVVIAGQPNAGKSTLLNALLGYTRAIVFDQPGTTRDVVSSETAFDGWPVLLSDTAGLREAADDIERQGIERARGALQSANLVVHLVDGSRKEDATDMRLAEELAARNNVLVVVNKSDLPQRRMISNDAVAISAATRAGVDRLICQIVTRLVPRVPPKGMPIPVTRRQTRLIAEALQAVRTGDMTAARDALQQCLNPTGC